MYRSHLHLAFALRDKTLFQRQQYLNRVCQSLMLN